MLPNKVCTPTLSIWIDGTPRPVVCSHPVALVSFPFLLQHLRSCFPSFTILSNSRSLRSPILFFLIFFVASGSLVCPLCHLLVLDRQFSCLVHPYHQVLIPIFCAVLSSSPRENSPSPTFRERQRAARGQSTSSFQGSYNGQPSPTASTTSFHQRRSPPLAAQTVPGQIRRATSPLYHSTSRDGSPEPPQAPTLSPSQQSLLHQMSPQQAHSRSQSDLLQHSANQMTPALGFARPVPRNAQPQFMSLDAFQMTPELIAEIDQAHSMGASMSGVAYAGGISSGPVSRSTQIEPGSLPKESTLERARSGERPNPRELGGGTAGMQRRDTTSHDKDRDSWELHRRGSVKRDTPQGMPAQQPSPQLEIQRTDSPKYLPSLTGGPNDHGSYNPSDRELRSAPAPASESNLQSFFETALKEYEKQAGTNLLDNRIIINLQSCESAEAINAILREQAQAFHKFRGNDGKLTRWLKRTVHVLHTLSTCSVLGAGVGLVRYKLLV